MDRAKTGSGGKKGEKMKFGCIVGLAGVLVCTGALPVAASNTPPETVIYSFKGGKDGANPAAGVIYRQGNLYGTTEAGGGDFNAGTVFKISPDRSETLLYSFCPIYSNGCQDGATPLAGVTMDTRGNIYTTTQSGGFWCCFCPLTAKCGTVFVLQPGGYAGPDYNFCTGSNCPDGAHPSGGVIIDSQGNLYGTTTDGGGSTHCGEGYGSGCGTVFKIGLHSDDTVLHSFCSTMNCPDGAHPTAGLVVDGHGNLYGTTPQGGTGVSCAGGCGTVFRVSSGGVETVLYNFQGGNDGSNPTAGLITDGQGHLYGTTSLGGSGNHGTVFEIAAGNRETVLYSFCSKSNCTDGSSPSGPLIQDKFRNLYGTTSEGGNSNSGTVFEVTLNGAETVLYSFCSQANCADGSDPTGGVVMDPQGDLYGTTFSGGGSGYGTVFLIPRPHCVFHLRTKTCELGVRG